VSELHCECNQLERQLKKSEEEGRRRCDKLEQRVLKYKDKFKESELVCADLQMRIEQLEAELVVARQEDGAQIRAKSYKRKNKSKCTDSEADLAVGLDKLSLSGDPLSDKTNRGGSGRELRERAQREL